MDAPHDISGTTGAAANQPLNPDLMGYPTVEALVNAKRASDQEAQRIVQENQALKQQLQYVYQPPANPRQDVVNRSSRPSDRLSEFGVPVDALQEFFGEQFQTHIAPLVAGANARNTVLARHPDYNKFEADVAQFITSDPELSKSFQAMFSADPVGASEYAFLKFGDSRRRTQPTGSDSLMQEASSHMGIPTSRNGDARRMDSNTNEVARARERWEQTRNPQDAIAYAKTRLHTAISDDHLNQ